MKTVIFEVEAVQNSKFKHVTCYMLFKHVKYTPYKQTDGTQYYSQLQNSLVFYDSMSVCE